MKQDYQPDYPLDKLTEWPTDENPRRGDTDLIGASIDRLGFYGAVLVQKSSGRIIAGNHRSRAAREHGADSVPALILDVTDDEARRIMLMDNASQNRASMDEAVLLETLRTFIDGDEADLAGTGYTDDELEVLTRTVEAAQTDWDIGAHWTGMPDYESENRLAAFKVTVYFTDKDEVPGFFKLIDRELTTRLWWPYAEDDAPGESWAHRSVTDA